MSQTSTETTQQTTQPTGEAGGRPRSGGCRCGCRGHGRARDDERLPGPTVAQPMAPGSAAATEATASQAQTGGTGAGAPGLSEAAAIGAAVGAAMGAALPAQDQPSSRSAADAGVVPGHKAGNALGLRDVSARPTGGCGCGSH